MRLPFRSLLCGSFAVMASACATFGTNVEGAFQCRAPKGDCAPSRVLDERASSAMANAPAGPETTLRTPRVVTAGDHARTAERTLRIVFPARVDEAGTLHDEAVAWAVIENPRWAAELRRKPGAEAAPPLMRQLKRQLKAVHTGLPPAAQRGLQDPVHTQSSITLGGIDGAAAGATREAALDPGVAFQPDPQTDLFPLVLPPLSPSAARETATGADAPVAGGFHAPASQHDRTPRLFDPSASITFPSISAIEAARRDAAASKDQPHQEDK